MAEIKENDQQLERSGDPTENGDQSGEKLFTQEDVSRIVKERLAKQKASMEKPSDREKELTARENRLTCREHLIETGAPAVLLDVLDTSDPDKFRDAVRKLTDSGFLPGGRTDQPGQERQPERRMKTGLSHGGGFPVGGGSEKALADAFKPPKR